MNAFIVIPTFNEQKTIALVIESLILEKFSDTIVVDDGSTDSTCEIVKKYPVKLIKHLVNLGQGAALRTGTEAALKAGADVIVHFDSDGQHKASEIKNFILEIENGHDVVLGSRFLSEVQHMPWSKKLLILKPAIMVNWLFTGLKLSDAHNGFRALSRDAAQKIEITQNKMAHSSEIISEINKHKLKFKEIPVEIMYHEYGQNFRGGLKVITDLLKQKLLY